MDMLSNFLSKNKYRSQMIAKKWKNKHRNRHKATPTNKSKKPNQNTQKLRAFNSKSALISKNDYLYQNEWLDFRNTKMIKKLQAQILEYKKNKYEKYRKLFEMKLKKRKMKNAKNIRSRYEKRKQHIDNNSESDNKIPIYRNRLLCNVFNKDYNNKGVIKKTTGEYAKILKHKYFKNKFQISKDSSLIISSSILLTFNKNKIKDNKVRLKLNKCKIDIFDKLTDVYWTSFVFLPCYKYESEYIVRKDLKIKFDLDPDKMKSELDDNYVFYYISQYCYEGRTPYIEYECQITPKLKRPLWKLNTIKHYCISDLLVNNCNENYLNDINNIYDILYQYLGYSNLVSVVVNAYCQYTIDNKQTQNELCFMKKYTPQKYIHSKIMDKYKEHYVCRSRKSYIRLKGKQYNGCKTFNFDQFYNIPCSFQGAIWGCNYIHHSTNKTIYRSGAAIDGSRAKYHKLESINIEDQSTMSRNHPKFWW